MLNDELERNHPTDPRPRGPIGFRLAHELEGLLEGIRADGIITPEETALLARWLDANREFADIRPFSELAMHLTAVLADGILGDDELDDLLFVVQKLTTVNPYFDSFRTGLQILMSILAGITADGVLDPWEIKALSDWLSNWSHLKTLWPYDECDAIVTTLLARGQTADELAYLQALAAQFPIAGTSQAAEAVAAPPLIRGVCAVAPAVTFADRRFVFTGDSAKATRAALATLVVGRGGHSHKGLRLDTDYLIVCDGGSPHWAFACYGRKVEKACQLRREGHPIVLVHEADFWDAVADQ
jgi:hypothetical protein